MSVFDKVSEAIETMQGNEIDIEFSQDELAELVETVPFMGENGFKWTWIAGVLHIEKLEDEKE